ncbi:MAG: hypothetical protein P0Y52_10215 [Candidatus Brevundimonas phytovorans]|nr:hypothetical protein [Brevundimonas sp.]WEK56919.1 MAG: hypothetical protein P0Y52_10215 [Brevundimonas sp.]
MKTALIASVLLSLAPAGQVLAQSKASSQSVEELTRLLNGGPPAAARPAPAPTPTPAPTPAPAAPVRSTVAATPRPASVQTAPAEPPVRAAPTPVAPAQVAPAPPPAPASEPPPPAPPPAVPLSPAAVAALPFRIDLPSGFQLFEGRSAPDAKVWSVRKAGKTFAMIYAGPSSQFPIYDGEQVTAAGRVSVIVPEGTRRIAMEHLFQRPVAPTEIHVWLMSLDGADRDAAERLAQSVDPR